ncbi:MAG: hypothetical protein H8F28_19770 [Fibrella sp.]|nr:hypothetical protein [Armatimonadota bacterium]
MEWSTGPFIVERVLFQKSGNNLITGQIKQVVEPVGVVLTPGSGAVRSILEDCFELKQGSRYVLFVNRGTDGTYGIDNFNLGRFNTDGTDCEDEIDATNGFLPEGIKTNKQRLREELTAQYGITFAKIGPCGP